ncbi:MAG: type III pantothenate kinase [Bacteroidia bacterium]
MDFGNTRTKIGLFDEQGQLVQRWLAAGPGLEQQVQAVCDEIAPDTLMRVAWVSVAQRPPVAAWDCWERFETSPVFHRIDAHYPFPIENRYATPATLGTDRIVAVIGALKVARPPLLVIDAGSAITFDFADAQGAYLGGGISPGIAMRFRALHTFTARLPLVEPSADAPLVGDSTVDSLLSGVMNGVRAEISGIVHRYRSAYGPELKAFLTGGDMIYFENLDKTFNFADSDLVLRGIFHLLNWKSS